MPSMGGAVICDCGNKHLAATMQLAISPRSDMDLNSLDYFGEEKLIPPCRISSLKLVHDLKLNISLRSFHVTRSRDLLCFQIALK
jgi:hypothetical protein